MIEALTDFEKQLIYAAFYKHVNMSPREMEKVVGADPLPDDAAPARHGAPSDPASADETGTQEIAEGLPGAGDADSIGEPEFLTEEQWIGRHLIRIKRAKKEGLVDADYVQMRGAVNYIRRHAARPPKSPDKMEEWRYNLRARGYDPDQNQSAELLAATDGLAPEN
jgi:hypothetical protein